MFVVAAGGANIDPGMVSQHREWAKSAGTGKIDFAKNFVTDAEADEFRRIVRQQLSKLDQVSRWAVSFLERGEGQDSEAGR